jgi:PIN domain nuclease of toxin-antitoxin system
VSLLLDTHVLLWWLAADPALTLDAHLARSPLTSTAPWN